MRNFANRLPISLCALLAVATATPCADQLPPRPKPMLSDQTIDTLEIFPRHLVAVVVCTGHAFTNQGSRSERVLISAQGVSGIHGKLTLSRYSQGDPLMIAGGTYLVAAYDDGEWAPAWSLVEWQPVDADDADEILIRVQRSLR